MTAQLAEDCDRLEALCRSLSQRPAGDPSAIARRILEQPKYIETTESTFDRLWAQFTEWLATVFARLTEAVGGSLQAGLIALGVVGLVGILAFTYLARRRAAVTSRHLTLERILEEGGDPDELDRLSRESAARGDYSTAIRQAFLAGLLRLDMSERITFRPGLTTGAIVDELNDPTFDELARMFEDIAYGGRHGDAESYPRAVDGWTALLDTTVTA